MMGIVQEQNLENRMEKQIRMGCMAGFLQIFDRHQSPSGKRLPPSTDVDSVPESGTTTDSPAVSKELEKQQQQTRSMPIPERLKPSQATELQSPARDAAAKAEIQSKLSLPLPIFELKEGTKSSWKFSKEPPRLSLDSRASFDKGRLKPREIRTNAALFPVNNGEETDDSEKQRRSSNVIARLMGLESLPGSEEEQVKKPELQRSASESRTSKDQFQNPLDDGVDFQLKQSPQQKTQGNVSSNVIRESVVKSQTTNARAVDRKEFDSVRKLRAEQVRVPHRGIGHRRSFFDSTDFFPEPKQSLSICGEIEKRLKMRGIVDPSKDLETLKQIFEALQLKGLLHSRKSSSQINHRSFVYDRNFAHKESPILGMKGDQSTPSSFRARPGVFRDSRLSGETFPMMIQRPDQSEIGRNVRNQIRGRSPSSPTRSECGVKSPSRRTLVVKTQTRLCNDSVEQRRVSPVQSPKVGTRRNAPDQTANRSPRHRKQVAGTGIYQKEGKVFGPVEVETSTISENSMCTSSQTDTERSKVDDYKEDRNLLERCGKLLHSIAEMTTTESQPSPVSVLDSSFYKDESSPSPVMKRRVDFKDRLAQLEDDTWSPAISPVQSKSAANSDDCDFIYVSDVFRASNCLPDDTDIFLLLEQQYLKGKDTSKVSKLQRKLIFDTITEILNRKRQLPPWKAIGWSNSRSSLQQIWAEFQRIRERDASDDLLEVICGALKKDLTGDEINRWEDCPIEMAESVLDIERLIFKDMISETIRDLAAFAGKCNLASMRRRKLVF